MYRNLIALVGEADLSSLKRACLQASRCRRRHRTHGSDDRLRLIDGLGTTEMITSSYPKGADIRPGATVSHCPAMRR